MQLPPKKDILKPKEEPLKIEQADDKSLFHMAVDGITPLTQERVQHAKKQLEPEPQFQSYEPADSIDSLYSEEFEPKTISNEDPLSFQRSGVQYRLFNQLRAGQLAVDAELDLHGMTIPIAHQQLAEFIHQCRQERIRCVRIIHGKGWGSKNNQPVLKTKLNSWLQQEQNVLAFCSTPIEDGGTGAVYVLLRRQRK